MAYQPLMVISNQNYPYRRAVVVLFNTSMGIIFCIKFLLFPFLKTFSCSTPCPLLFLSLSLSLSIYIYIYIYIGYIQLVPRDYQFEIFIYRIDEKIHDSIGALDV